MLAKYYQLIEFCQNEFEKLSTEGGYIFVFPLEVSLPPFLLEYTEIAFGVAKYDWSIVEDELPLEPFSDELPLEPFSLEEYSKDSLSQYIKESWNAINYLLEKKPTSFLTTGKFYIQMIFYFKEGDYLSVYPIDIAEIKALEELI